MNGQRIIQIAFDVEPFCMEKSGSHRVRARIRVESNGEASTYGQELVFQPNNFKSFFDQMWESAGRDIKRHLLQEDMVQRGALTFVEVDHGA